MSINQSNEEEGYDEFINNPPSEEEDFNKSFDKDIEVKEDNPIEEKISVKSSKKADSQKNITDLEKSITSSKELKANLGDQSELINGIEESIHSEAVSTVKKNKPNKTISLEKKKIIEDIESKK
ncbi:MAG: hypothetical protein MJ252_21815 [archaeon]|nr:hypothetical protein [archaeon]